MPTPTTFSLQSYKALYEATYSLDNTTELKEKLALAEKLKENTPKISKASLQILQKAANRSNSTQSLSLESLRLCPNLKSFISLVDGALYFNKTPNMKHAFWLEAGVTGVSIGLGAIPVIGTIVGAAAFLTGSTIAGALAVDTYKSDKNDANDHLKELQEELGTFSSSITDITTLFTQKTKINSLLRRLEKNTEEASQTALTEFRKLHTFCQI